MNLIEQSLYIIVGVWTCAVAAWTIKEWMKSVEDYDNEEQQERREEWQMLRKTSRAPIPLSNNNGREKALKRLNGVLEV